MDIISLLFISVGLAMDAFSVAVTDGIILKHIKIRNALKIALYFGIFQFGMLFLGDMLGSVFAGFIKSVDHWIAFVLLSVIGGKMIYDAMSEEEEENHANPLSDKTLVVLAIATSIDALAVGISFAAMGDCGFTTQLSDALFASGVVGVVAFLFSFVGVYIGNKCGNLFGNKSEIFGGIVLVGIGVKILVEHLFF